MAKGSSKRTNARISGLDVVVGGRTADTFSERTSGDEDRGDYEEGEGEHRVILSRKGRIIKKVYSTTAGRSSS